MPGMYSIGLHPWYITEPLWKLQLQELKKWSAHKQVLAIGECGLDKVCSTDFLLQQEVFREQINWANEIQKPLIIHCVKAYEQCIQQLTKQKCKVPVIFHGFNKSKELAQQLVRNGYYISAGNSIAQEKMKEVLQSVPVEFLFLETDDTGNSIKKIYELATAILQIDLDSLCLQLQKNAASVFGAAAMHI